MRGTVLFVTVLLCACEREPTFDERYRTAQDRIEDKAVELDAELISSPRSQQSADEEAEEQTDAAPAG